MPWRARLQMWPRCGPGCRKGSYPRWQHPLPPVPRRDPGPPAWFLLVVLRRAVRFLLDLIQDGRILQSRDISQLAPFGDVSEQPSHDLSGTSLGQIFSKDDRLRAGYLADLLG